MVGLRAQLGERAGLTFAQVPFAHADHQRAALALDQIGDAQILLLERLLGIHQQHHHFGEADGVERVGDRELLELLLDLRAAAHARGVVEAEGAALPVEIDRDGVARDAGLRPGEQALLAEQAVDQRRLAGVGPADHGDADRPRRIVVRRLVFSRRLARSPPAAPRAARRRDRTGPRRARPRSPPARRARAHRPRAGRPRRLCPRSCWRRRSPACPDLRIRSANTPVVRHQAGARIDQEEHRVGLRDRRLGLRRPCGRRGSPAPRSSRPAVSIAVKSRSPSRAVALAAVARHARQVVDQREPLADQPVEQRRLADIRPADDGDGEAHGSSSSARLVPGRGGSGQARRADCRRRRGPGRRSGPGRRRLRGCAAPACGSGHGGGCCCGGGCWLWRLARAAWRGGGAGVAGRGRGRGAGLWLRCAARPPPAAAPPAADSPAPAPAARPAARPARLPGTPRVRSPGSGFLVLNQMLSRSNVSQPAERKPGRQQRASTAGCGAAASAASALAVWRRRARSASRPGRACWPASRHRPAPCRSSAASRRRRWRARPRARAASRALWRNGRLGAVSGSSRRFSSS